MANVLTELSNALADAVRNADSGVVRVDARRRLPASGIIWSAEGLILTAHHVLKQDDGIEVGLAEGQLAQATVVGRDPTTDLALIRVEADGLAPMDRAEMDSLHVGNLVLALGRPGRTVQATLGVVSALGDNWRTRHGGLIDRYLQTDVVMYPGFSGGPLVDANGRLLGLNSSGLAQGISLTLPLATLERVVQALQSHGRVRRGYLGVSTQLVRLPQPLREQVGQKSGLLLVAVELDSPAQKAGLTLGDTIVALDGNSVRHHDDLLGLLGGDRVGTAAQVQFIRGGEVMTREITLGERP